MESWAGLAFLLTLLCTEDWTNDLPSSPSNFLLLGFFLPLFSLSSPPISGTIPSRWIISLAQFQFNTPGLVFSCKIKISAFHTDFCLLKPDYQTWFSCSIINPPLLKHIPLISKPSCILLFCLIQISSAILQLILQVAERVQKASQPSRLFWLCLPEFVESWTQWISCCLQKVLKSHWFHF